MKLYNKTTNSAQTVLSRLHFWEFRYFYAHKDRI